MVELWEIPIERRLLAVLGWPRQVLPGLEGPRCARRAKGKCLRVQWGSQLVTECLPPTPGGLLQPLVTAEMRHLIPGFIFSSLIGVQQPDGVTGIPGCSSLCQRHARGGMGAWSCRLSGVSTVRSCCSGSGIMWPSAPQWDCVPAGRTSSRVFGWRLGNGGRFSPTVNTPGSRATISGWVALPSSPSYRST